METTTWFLASAIAAGAGVAAGVILGPWGAWIGSILAGATVTAASRRLSGLAGASVVAGSVGALIVAHRFTAALVAVASVVLIAGLAAAYVFLARLLIRSPKAPTSTPTELKTPSSRAQQAARSTTEAGRRSGELLEPWQVDYLVRLAARDRDEYARQVSALRPQQRAQVERAIQGSVRAVRARTDEDAADHHER